MLLSQTEIINQINDLKNKILKSSDRVEIIFYLKDIIKIAVNAPLKNSGTLLGNNYYPEARKRAIEMMNFDLDAIEDGTYYDLSLVHFQSATSILIFLLTMVDGGVSEIDRIINEFCK